MGRLDVSFSAVIDSKEYIAASINALNEVLNAKKVQWYKDEHYLNHAALCEIQKKLCEKWKMARNVLVRSDYANNLTNSFYTTYRNELKEICALKREYYSTFMKLAKQTVLCSQKTEQENIERE